MGDPWYHHLNADCRFVGLSRFSFAVFGFGAKAKPLTVECKPKGWGEEGRGGVTLEIALRKLHRRRSRWHRWLRFVPLQRQIGNWELKWMRYKR